MCGVGYTSIKSVFDVMKIPSISENAFHKKVQSWLNPVVFNMFIPMRDSVINKLKSENNLVFSGDGQFDSPGHSAKNCIYTILDNISGKIVDFVITQRGMFSEELEKAGAREILTKLINKGINDFKLVTDRHSGIRKMVRDNAIFSNIEHSFDIWHLAKSLSKKLTKLTKLKKHQSLLPYTRKIINHFWYSSRNSKGDPTKLIETFHSVLLHLTNGHRWTRGALSKLRGEKEYPKFTKVLKCNHGRLNKKNLRRGAWLKRSSLTFKALFDCLTQKQLSDDMKHCTHFIHTGSLENYHSVRLKYLPKRIHFTRETTVIRSMLVVIETNSNITEHDPQNPKMYSKWSRQSATWVMKKGYDSKDYTYRHTILNQIKANVSLGIKLDVDMSEYIPRNIPKNIAPTPKPSKQQLVNEYKTRMTRRTQ